MPTLEPRTETRDVDSVDQIDGVLKNIKISYKVKGGDGYWGGNPRNLPRRLTQNTSGKHLNFMEKEKSLQGTNNFI